MNIRIVFGEEIREISVFPGPSLLALLDDQDIPVNSACGGKGSCQKCRVQVQKGFCPISGVDRQTFTEEELKQGWRLSCQSRPRANLAIKIPNPENPASRPRLQVNSAAAGEPHSLICDLGSTGVVLAAVDTEGTILAECHLLNKQVRYGADVMTRLQAAQEGKGEALHKSLVSSIQSCLRAMEKALPGVKGIAKDQGIFCAGNSVVLSFLHAWSTDKLAVSPFQPAQLDSHVSQSADVKLHSLPLLGGFVGGDTYAGILSILARDIPRPWMLVDIGTNTEIVIQDETEKIYYCSAPAGPAFEGGNISQGMRAEPGAIAHAYFEGRWDVETIAGDIPKGICGSGLMDILFEGVKGGLIQKDGFVEGQLLPVTGDILLRLDDIREFQLAKSATRTACDLLMDRAGCRPKKIYLAGTFAEHLRLDSVHGIGLLPEEIPAEILGNASLQGSIIYAGMSPEKRSALEVKLRSQSEQIELALQDDFQEFFVKNLNF